MSTSSETSPQTSVLGALLPETSTLRGALLMTEKGEVQDETGPECAKLRTLASFAVGLYDLGARLAMDSGSGVASELTMRCAEGTLVVHALPDGRLLAALLSKTASSGALLHDLGRCARQLGAS